MENKTTGRQAEASKSNLTRFLMCKRQILERLRARCRGVEFAQSSERIFTESTFSSQLCTDRFCGNCNHHAVDHRDKCDLLPWSCFSVGNFKPQPYLMFKSKYMHAVRGIRDFTQNILRVATTNLSVVLRTF